MTVVTWGDSRYEATDDADLHKMLDALDADPNVERYTVTQPDGSWVTSIADGNGGRTSQQAV